MRKALSATHDTAVCKQIRVVIANSPGAMRDMLFEAVRNESHFAVVAEVSDGVSIASICEMERADYVVVPLEDGRAPIHLCKQILKKRPDMKVIALTAAAEISALCWWSQGGVHCTYMKSSRDNLVKVLTSPASEEGRRQNHQPATLAPENLAAQ